MTTAVSSSLFDRRAPLALILLCVALAGSTVGFRVAVQQFNISIRKERVEMRDTFDTLPLSLGEWTGTRSPKLSVEVVEELGTSSYFDGEFRKDGSSPVRLGVHLAYYTGFIDAVPHVPDRCLVAGGFNVLEMPTNLDLPLSLDFWPISPDDSELHQIELRNQVTGQPMRIHLPRGEMQLRTSVYSDSKRPDLRLIAGYFFIANGEMTPGPEGVKRLAFARRQKYAYYCKVQFHMATAKTYDLDLFQREVADLLQSMLPEIMRCLPDWPEVQARTNPSPSPTAE